MIDRDRCLHDILLFGTHEYLISCSLTHLAFPHYMLIVI